MNSQLENILKSKNEKWNLIAKNNSKFKKIVKKNKIEIEELKLGNQK